MTSYGFNDSSAKAAGYAIKVEVYDNAGEDGQKAGTLSETLYFDNMQKALDGTVNEKATNAQSNNVYKTQSQDGYKTQRKATITLLDDISSTGFRIMGSTFSGAPSQLDYKDVHLTINLDGHTYAFTSPVANDVSGDRKKAITINRNRPDSTSYVVINGGNGGTLKVADKTEAEINRLIRSYVDLTLTDVTLDGTNLKTAEQGVNEATVCHSAGTLTVNGSTTFINQSGLSGNSFYDITGKLGTSRKTFGNYYANGFSINIDTTGNIPNIALAAWPDSPPSSNKIERYLPLDFSKASLNITNGNIGTIALNKTAVELGGMSRITIGENAKFDTFETVTSASDYVASPTGIDTILAVANSNIWNPDSSESNKYNYLLKSDTKAVTLTATEGADSGNDGKVASVEYATVATDTNAQIGEVLLSASDVANKDRLTPLVNMGTGAASLFGVPYDANITWNNDDGSVPAGYNVAYLNYNNGETAVTLKTAADAIIQSSIKAASGGTDTPGILATTVRDIDASDNTFAVTLKGHASDANTLRGGTGSDLLTGNTGTVNSDLFGYNGGADTISGYTISDKGYDTVVLSDIDIVTAADSVKAVVTNGSSSDLVIAFGGANSLTFEGRGTVTSEVNGVKIQSGKTIYNYSNRSIADDDSITLTSNYTTTSGALSYRVSNYSKKVDASAVTLAAGIAITGNDKDNYIIGSNYVAESGGTKTPVKNTLYGGAGNDTLTGGAGEDVFQYSDGKDFIEGYSLAQGDKASMAAGDIVSAKSSRKGLAFTFKNSKNVLTFSPDDKGDVAGKISLSGANAGYLTQDGYVDNDSEANFKLFSGTKGAIDLTDTLAYGGGNISFIDASITKNGVTITGDKNIKSLTFGKNNKKDLFEYGGGSVTISGFETGKDRIDIGNIGPITSFEVGKTGGGADDVLITIKEAVEGTSAAAEVISLTSVKDKEVLMRDAEGKSNSFSKYVFHDNGVLYNKEKKPTEANIYSNVDKTKAFKADDSVKKIFLQSGVANVSIQSGNNKATLDASAAGFKADVSTTGVGVSLVGGTKNNKFTGTNYADTFYYYGGKDNVTNFQFGESVTDSIALGDTSFKIEEAKISLARKSLKFKFDSKNTLALKSDSTISGALYVDGKEYTFEKNAIGVGGNVSLTSQFSGTYKLENGTSAVDGRAVKKNLTFKGTDAAESLVGGQKKTTFKGGGGNDTLVGNATGKDIFFYAKGDKGTTKIVDFGFSSSDKLKIANGTISDIKQDTNKVTFAMTSGKKGDTTDIGWFEVDTSKPTTDNKKIAIKANNTYYWFADGGETLASSTEDNTLTASAGDLITLSRKVTAREVNGCAVIDLGYSTNLVKKELAFKVVDTTALPTSTTPTQQNNNNNNA